MPTLLAQPKLSHRAVLKHLLSDPKFHPVVNWVFSVILHKQFTFAHLEGEAARGRLRLSLFDSALRTLLESHPTDAFISGDRAALLTTAVLQAAKHYGYSAWLSWTVCRDWPAPNLVLNYRTELVQSVRPLTSQGLNIFVLNCEMRPK